MITDKPVLTVGAVVFAVVGLVGGIVGLILDRVTFDDFLLLVGVLGAPFAIGSGVARAFQGRSGPSSYQ